jgi:hypothetical protein
VAQISALAGTPILSTANGVIDATGAAQLIAPVLTVRFSFAPSVCLTDMYVSADRLQRDPGRAQHRRQQPHRCCHYNEAIWTLREGSVKRTDVMRMDGGGFGTFLVKIIDFSQLVSEPYAV